MSARKVICDVGEKQIGLSAAAVSCYLNISKMTATTGGQKGKEIDFGDEINLT